jgi:hypothetical protein
MYIVHRLVVRQEKNITKKVLYGSSPRRQGKARHGMSTGRAKTEIPIWIFANMREVHENSPILPIFTDKTSRNPPKHWFSGFFQNRKLQKIDEAMILRRNNTCSRFSNGFTQGFFSDQCFSQM